MAMIELRKSEWHNPSSSVAGVKVEYWETLLASGMKP